MSMQTTTAFGGSLPASASARASKETQRGASGWCSGVGARAIEYVFYFLLSMITLLASAAGSMIYPVQPAFGLGHRFPAVNWFSLRCSFVYYSFMAFYALLYGYVAFIGIKITFSIIAFLVNKLSKIAPIPVGWAKLSVMGFCFFLHDSFDYGRSVVLAVTNTVLVACSTITTFAGELAQVILADILLSIAEPIVQAIDKWGALEADLANGEFSACVQANLDQVTVATERASKASTDLKKQPAVFAEEKVPVVEPVNTYNSGASFVAQEDIVAVKNATKERRRSARLTARVINKEEKTSRRKAGRKSKVPVDPSTLRRSARLANAR